MYNTVINRNIYYTFFVSFSYIMFHMYIDSAVSVNIWKMKRKNVDKNSSCYGLDAHHHVGV